MSEVQDAMIVALNKAQAERDEARAALRHLRDHYEPSVGTNYVCAGMAEYVCEVANRVLLNGEDE